jgi:type II secretory pathway component GspD/PulD (secretin)
MKTYPLRTSIGRRTLSGLISLAILVPIILTLAQDTKPVPPTQVAVPSPTSQFSPGTPPIVPAIPVTDPPAATPSPAAVSAAAGPAPAASVPAAGMPSAVSVIPGADVEAASERNPIPTGTNIRMNFQGASLPDVLNYLSEAAGFVIVQETPVSGTVNIISHQAVSPDEAVDLLDTVLSEKGYAALRNGRVLHIIQRNSAQKRDLPVNIGANPAMIPRKEAVVTQILPLKFGDAAKLVQNLQPLLSDSATITANEASNAILMVDTQANIRRIATIISALDTSVASISAIHIFKLNFADSKSVADLITQLFAPSPTQGQGRAGGGAGGAGRRGGGGPGGGFAAFFGGGGGPGGGGGGNGGASTPDSEARAAETRVVAVADQQSNSVVVSAPEDTISEIQEIINEIDTSLNDVTVTHIFRLQHADSVELAQTVNNLFGDGTTSSTPNRSQPGQNLQRGFGNQGGGGGGGGGNRGATTTATNDRALLQSKVTAVGDPRTNYLLVTASKDTMTKIATVVAQLDSPDSRTQHVYFYSLQHADAENVADVLRGMLGQQTTGAAAANATSTLQQRQIQGATTNAQDVLNTNSGPGGS